MKPTECRENASATCQDGTAESKGDEDTGEKTGQSKKRHRSEKQRERTRQYKKKIRRAKTQMMREKKLAERNINGSYMACDSWSIKPHGPKLESPSIGLLQTSGNKIELKSTGENKTLLIENPAEQVSLQLTPAVNIKKEAEVDEHRYEDKRVMKDDSMSHKSPAPQTGCGTDQTEERREFENIGVNKKLSKENLAEQISVQLGLAINLTTQAAADADAHEDINPDTNVDSMSLKQQEPTTACGIDQLLPQTEEKEKSEKTRVDKKLPKENLAEQAFVQLRPAVNITADAAVDEARNKNLILDDTADRQDILGILSVYVDSSIHCDYDKDPKVTTSPVSGNVPGYVYFSMKEFWK